MNIESFGLNKVSGEFDQFIEEKVTTCKVQAASKLLPSLNLTSLKSISKQIEMISSDEFKVVLKSNSITAGKLLRRIKSSNEDIYDIVYSDELEGDELQNVSEKPLWSLSKVGNILTIKRVI